MLSIPGSLKAMRTLENIGACYITLTADKKAEIVNGILNSFTVKGARYTAATPLLWG
ncbi:hypothetical protein M422DRAFT_253869 [Sphaerobolus stellatus SS14]|uniref:Uncharacterized protein n=1 Tax=Sphaerobolus stellatus (strain SS14) TaxID=990650 RepID=A0A0C9VLX1_SPHS4|nr:hypothetical protein M422DRAFT_253869 [Sphaerobolus stellatus SS14]